MPWKTRGGLRPLGVQVLATLPGPAWVWVLAWACVPWLNFAANLLLGTTGAIWDESRVLAVVNYIFLSFAVVITLWGSERIARRLEALDALTPTVRNVEAGERFRELKSVVVPIAGSVATAVAFGAAALIRDGWGAAALRGATWFVLGIAFWSFLWTYATVQLGLHRIGRERLLPSASSVDPSLGLRPLGSVAFTSLWMLLLWLVPVFWTGLPDIVGLAVALLLLSGALAAFFLSMFQVHRQMVQVKTNEVAIARELYAEAYEPLRTAPNLETLERQQGLLGAANALEQRARGIHEWPVDEGTFARVIAIATSVVAATIGRLILEPLGL